MSRRNPPGAPRTKTIWTFGVGTGVNALAPSNRRIIFQSDHVRLILDEKGTDTVVLSFNEMNFVWNGVQYWGQKILDPLRATVLGFVTPEPNWYPPHDMERAIPAAIEAIAGRRVVTFGFSQGGYGALKFSRALSASTAFAFCPLWSINPEDVGCFDVRTAPYYRPALKNGHRIKLDDLCDNNFVIFDPREVCDQKNAERILEHRGTSAVVAPFCGHAVIKMVAESQISRPLAERIQDPNVTARELRTIIRSGRRNSPLYRGEKLKLLLQRAKAGTLFLERHLALYEDETFKTIIRATAAFLRGDSASAARTLTALSTETWLTQDLFALWRIFWEAKLTVGETTLAPLLKIKYPEDCHIRLHAINTYLRYKLIDKALEEMAVLVNLPNAYKQAHLLADFYHKLGKPELRAAFLRKSAEDAWQSKIRLIENDPVSPHLLAGGQ